jgi:hypothetical protein
MITDNHWPKHACASSDIDMTTNGRDAARSDADSDLLENEAVGTDPAIRMNNDAVRVGNEQSPADKGIKRYVGPSHN